ncbi:MAG: 50S ribosome-binding GTPase [Solobacterium sp.]|nr:50S ribosome-binding GTPase [Solobacterium sp.]
MKAGLFSKRKKQTDYEKIIHLNDDRINVLLLGNSGCGKSTLINAVLGREEAETGTGTAVTKNIEVYEDANLPFRMIDTVGYEYGLFKQYRIKNDLNRFSEESVRKKDVQKLIHIIWYCIDGTSKRIDQEAMNYISSVTKSWKGIPVIFVITKSYSETEIAENRRMAEEAVAVYNKKHRHNPINVQDVIPVVAKEYRVNETTVIPPSGLDTLLLRTNELTPKAKRLADEAIRSIDIKIKNDRANLIITTAAAASAAIGAVPIAVPDSTVLIPIQSRMIKELTKAYDLQEDELNRDISKKVLQIGATTIAGKAIVKALKQVPVLNVAASLVDAAVAGTVTFVLGKTSAMIFERVYTGEFDPLSMPVDEELKRIFDDLMPDITEQLTGFLEETKGSLTLNQIKDFFESLKS